MTAVLAAIRSSLRTRAELELEILALRHQLAVLQQAAPRRLRLSRADRLLWVLLSRVWRGWRGAVQESESGGVFAQDGQGSNFCGAQLFGRTGFCGSHLRRLPLS